MKNNKWILPLAVILLTLIYSCRKEDQEPPTIVTVNVSAITYSSAISGGDIISDGGEDINSRGVCWGTEQTPTISDNKTTDGTGVGKYSSNITGLSTNTKYFLRAYAINNIGTAYGETKSFITLNEDLTVTDIDGNIYKTVTIGTQVWMAENLKTTKYRNGDPITNVNGEQWDNLTTGAYCLYNNNEDNRSTYGLLYNWYAADDSRNICPEGWHIPTYKEWETLASTGMELKELGTTHWISPNNCYPNNSGFTGLPGGNCGFDGDFNGLTEDGYWWTADEENNENAWISMMSHINLGLSGWVDGDKWIGTSIRCIKD